MRTRLITRRGLLAQATLAVSAGQSLAQPGRPLRLVVPFPSGGGAADAVGRVVAPALATQLGQQVIVENRPGAGGSLGAELVARAEPDGGTLLLVASNVATINPHLYALPYRPDELTGVGLISRGTLGVVVPASGPETLAVLLDDARRRPGILAYGSAGNGTPSHIAGAFLQRGAGISLVHVPYRGSPPLAIDLIAGRVQLAIDSLPPLLGHVREGRLRLLAVTSPMRWFATPDTPTVAETQPNFEFMSWYGLQVPAHTPRPILDRLGVGLSGALADQATSKRLRDIGMEPASSTPEAMDQMIAVESARWRDIILAAAIKPD